MTAPVLASSVEADLNAAVLTALRSDSSLALLFGDPARIIDDESTRAVFPFVQLEHWQSEPSDTSGRRGLALTATFVVLSRHGGRSQSRALVGALRASLDALELDLPGQKLVLVQTVFSDVVRGADLRHFRGVVRVRFLTQALISPTA
ncbi:MAG: DUF3168 domain-containing protein [Pseudomonadota bacterium]